MILHPIVVEAAVSNSWFSFTSYSNLCFLSLLTKHANMKAARPDARGREDLELLKTQVKLLRSIRTNPTDGDSSGNPSCSSKKLSE